MRCFVYGRLRGISERHFPHYFLMIYIASYIKDNVIPGKWLSAAEVIGIRKCETARCFSIPNVTKIEPDPIRRQSRVNQTIPRGISKKLIWWQVVG